MENKSNVKTGQWESLPDVFQVKDLAVFLNIGLSKAYELIHQDSLETFRVGKAIRISKVGLLKWINRQMGTDVDSNGTSCVGGGRE